METYVIIAKFEGSSTAEMEPGEGLAAQERMLAALAAVGGKLVNMWTTLGRFDLLVVVQVPDASAVRAFVAALPGQISTETIRAFGGEADDSAFVDYTKKILGQ